MKVVKLWLPVILWAGLIFFLSAQPDLKLEVAGGFDFFLRKLAHMTEFGVLFLLLYRAIINKKSPPALFLQRGGILPLEKGGWGGSYNKKSILFAFLIALLYVISDEFHQSFVVGRVASILDVGIDAVGILIAAVWTKKVSGTFHKST